VEAEELWVWLLRKEKYGLKELGCKMEAMIPERQTISFYLFWASMGTNLDSGRLVD